MRQSRLYDIPGNSFFYTVLYAQFTVFFKQKRTFIYMKEYIPLEDGDYYLSEEGYKVFTEQYHLKRGYCCESNCRHCPYGFDGKIN